MHRKENLRWIVWPLALLAAGCGGNTQRQQMLLSEGTDAYQAAQYRQAVDRMSELLSTSPPPAARARAEYLRGISRAKLGERLAAIRDLEAAAAGGDADRDAAWRAAVVLGSMHFEDGRWDPAGEAYATAAALMPPEPPKDFVLFRIANCYERTGRWNDALQVYADLVEAFPTSSLAEVADRRLRQRPTHFAIQAGAFGDEKNAENFALQLERAGLPVTIRHEPQRNKTLHLVLVGQYDSYEEAFRQLGRVRGMVPDAQIWP